ncbi:MAG: OadG family transporter subunit [Muribaculaceae bacterium]
MNKKGIILFLLAVVCTISVNAQSHKGLRISEVMVENNSNYTDEYGNRSAWIELYNTTRRTMNFSSIFITTQRVEEGQLPDRSKMYLVPRGDSRTKVEHLQSAVFFADGKPQQGTFHTSITLTPGVENYIAVYDSDGLTKLDEVVIPANLPANCSFARNNKIEELSLLTGNTFNAQHWSIRNGESGSEITPAENNYVIGANDKIEQFEKNDSHGFILTIMAMAIVFSALVLLSICFFIFGSINKRINDKKKAQKNNHRKEPIDEPETDEDADGEVIAAIAMALYQHLNAHDEESNVLTFKRRHSDWNSKIATLTELSSRR